MLHKHSRHSPTPKPIFKTHVQAHEAVIGNELWYGDQPPSLGQGFTAADTAERHATVTGILLRAAKAAEKADTDEAQALYQLLDKLEACRPRRRCGSLACPLCARAFQRAKIAAQQTAITTATKKRAGRQLVFVTVIPKTMMYAPGEMHRIDIRKANRWLRDVITPVGKRMMLGSADLGWEKRRGTGYIQIHWHLVMWTGNRKNLRTKLASVFSGTKKHERPVDVKVADDIGFLPYMNKAIKLPALLRTNRTDLPELLLVLDRTDPIDLMVYTRLRLTAQYSALAFKPIG